MQQTLLSTCCMPSTVTAVNKANKSLLLRSLHFNGETDNKYVNVNKMKGIISDSDRYYEGDRWLTKDALDEAY